MKYFFILASLAAFLFLSSPNEVKAQKKKTTKSRQQPVARDVPLLFVMI
jgi:hypothetical protein